jgi:hypothetical protein
VKFIDPKIRITGCAIMAVVSYFVAVVNVIDGDVRSGVLLAIGGVYFTTVCVRSSRRYLSDHD